MQAWMITAHGAAPEVMVIEDRQLPACGPGELRIAVAAAAIGLPDVMMCKGIYEYKPTLPFTAGQEVCGTVLETGTGVSCAAGDRVMGVTSFFLGYGGFAEQCMSMEGMVYPVPDSMSDREAAAFGIPYQTAWIGLHERAQLQRGEIVLVLGAAGGSGSAAVQLAKALGARVIAVAGSDSKLAACKEFGADEVINHRTQDVVAEVNRLSDGCGADIIFDPVGGALCKTAAEAIASGGRLLAVGFASGEWAGVSTHTLVIKNASLVGVFAGAYSPDQRQGFHQQLVALYEAGHISPLIQDVIEFEQLPAAMAKVEAAEVVGKYVVSVKED